MSEPTKQQLRKERDSLASSVNTLSAENRILQERNQQLRSERQELMRTILRLRNVLGVISHQAKVGYEDGMGYG